MKERKTDKGKKRKKHRKKEEIERLRTNYRHVPLNTHTQEQVRKKKIRRKE